MAVPAVLSKKYLGQLHGFSDAKETMQNALQRNFEEKRISLKQKTDWEQAEKVIRCVSLCFCLDWFLGDPFEANGTHMRLQLKQHETALITTWELHGKYVAANEGLHSDDTQKQQAGIESMLQTAKSGYALVQHALGMHYYKNNDWENAVHWFATASQQTPSLAQAQYSYGRCLELGRGAKQNLSDARTLYEKAAKSHPPSEKALKRLSRAYEKGDSELGIEPTPGLLFNPYLLQAVREDVLDKEICVKYYNKCKERFNKLFPDKKNPPHPHSIPLEEFRFSCGSTTLEWFFDMAIHPESTDEERNEALSNFAFLGFYVWRNKEYVHDFILYRNRLLIKGLELPEISTPQFQPYSAAPPAPPPTKTYLDSVKKELQNLKQDLCRELDLDVKKTPYLGLRKTWRQIALKFHPDKVQQEHKRALSPQENQKANEKYLQVVQFLEKYLDKLKEIHIDPETAEGILDS